MLTKKAKHFFISYTKADVLWAEWIAWELEAHGHKTTLAAWHFKPGQNFMLEMDKALTVADAILAILSPEYLGAIYTKYEWSVALVKNRADDKSRIVPVRVKDCVPQGLFSNIIYIDLVDLTEVKARHALLSGLRPPGKPPVKPRFPGLRSLPQSMFPGVLPPVWNISQKRNEKFKGRENFLVDLHKALTSSRGSAVAIVGETGIGKTEVAREYAYRHQEKYKVVWWLRNDALATDYASLARALHGPEKELGDQVLAVQSVQQWLGKKKNKDWLLIFDSAQNQAELANYVPRDGKGHVLITSRNENWQDMANVVKLGPLDSVDAATFFLPVPEAA